MLIGNLVVLCTAPYGTLLNLHFLCSMDIIVLILPYSGSRVDIEISCAVHFSHMGPYLNYNHTTSNLAIYPMKHLKLNCQGQVIIVIQVHDKLNEKLLISTCSFLWINESG